jgi:hypothetical protein
MKKYKVIGATWRETNKSLIERFEGNGEKPRRKIYR